MEEIELYQPSNATEGDCFMSLFCHQCRKWRDNSYARTQCKIVLRSYAHNISDPEYPKQWRYINNFKPICTAYVDRKEHNRIRRLKYRRRRKDLLTLDMWEENNGK